MHQLDCPSKRRTVPSAAPDRAGWGFRPLAVAIFASLLLPISAVAGIATGSAEAQTATSDEMVRVAEIPLPGTWETGTAGYFMAIDETARRIIVERDTTTSRSAPTYNQRMFFVYDADTFELLQDEPFPGDIVSHGAHAVDERGHRLFVPAKGDGLSTSLYVYDTRDMSEPLQRFDDLPNGWHSTGGQPGFEYQDSTGLLYAIGQTPDQRRGELSAQLYAFDPNEGEIVWRFDLRRYCNTPVADQPAQAALGFSRDERHLSTVCAVGALGSTAVVRFSLSEDPREPPTGAEVFPGITPGAFTANSTWVPGVDRMITEFRTQSRGAGVYVFDGPTSKFLATPGVLVPPGGAAQVQYKNSPPFAMDDRRGRVYFQGPAVAGDPETGCQSIVSNSIATLDAETLEVNRFDSGDRSLGESPRAMAFDSQRRRLWITNNAMKADGSCDETATASEGDMSLVVYEDRSRPPEPLLESDPDAPTENIPEEEGKTDANVSADASAYGARYQLAPSGIEGPLFFIPGGNACGTAREPAILGLPDNAGLDFPNPVPPPPAYDALCRSGSREITFARAPTVSLDNQEAFATATGVELDPDSENDLGNATDLTRPGPYANSVSKAGHEAVEDETGVEPPTRIPGVSGVDSSEPCDDQVDDCFPFEGTSIDRFLGGQRVPVEPARCGDHEPDDDAHEDLERQHTYVGQGEPFGERDPLAQGGMEATTTCDLGSWFAQATATTNSASAGLPVMAGESSVAVTVQRTERDGALVELSSEVDSIVLRPFLKVGHLRVDARLHAHGRPDTSRVDRYECTVAGVVITPPNADPVAFPGETDCQDPDLRAAVEGLNEALISKGRIEFPRAPTFSDVADERNPELRVVQSWSPGGYRADLAVAEAQRLENLALLSDSAVEHPALRITTYIENNSTRNRLVASFGGVAGSTRYGIYRLSDFSCPGCGAGGGGGEPIARGILAPQVQSRTAQTQQGTPAEFVTIEEAGSTQPAPTVPPPSGPRALFENVLDGFRFLLNNPGALLAVLAVWVLLGWPWFVLSRRRALTQAVEGVR